MATAVDRNYRCEEIEHTNPDGTIHRVRVGSNVKIDRGASIYRDVVIGPNSYVQRGARIYSRCKIGENVDIGHGVVLGYDCRIGANTSMFEGAVVDSESLVGNNVVLETKTRVGANCVIEDGVHLTYGVIVPRGIMIKASTIITGAQHAHGRLHDYDFEAVLLGNKIMLRYGCEGPHTLDYWEKNVSQISKRNSFPVKINRALIALVKRAIPLPTKRRKK